MSVPVGAMDNSGTDVADKHVDIVDIFVSENCFVCDYAYEVAEMIQHNFPAVQVRIIDIDQAVEPIPEQVFATPTYLLNGKVWSLGNPSPEKIIETLSQPQYTRLAHR